MSPRGNHLLRNPKASTCPPFEFGNFIRHIQWTLLIVRVFWSHFGIKTFDLVSNVVGLGLWPILACLEPNFGAPQENSINFKILTRRTKLKRALGMKMIFKKVRFHTPVSTSLSIHPAARASSSCRFEFLEKTKAVHPVGIEWWKSLATTSFSSGWIPVYWADCAHVRH